LARAQTLRRYAYVRHQEMELATESIKKQATMPLLPALSHSHIQLPQPSATVALPVPVTTTHPSVR
jgi:hypothetical protein